MIHCPHCGYDLRGTITPERPHGQCPECGKWGELGAMIERRDASQAEMKRFWRFTLFTPLPLALFIVLPGSLILDVVASSPTIGLSLTGCWFFVFITIASYMLANHAMAHAAWAYSSRGLPWMFRSYGACYFCLFIIESALTFASVVVLMFFGCLCCFGIT